jgi:hypothetical protein
VNERRPESDEHARTQEINDDRASVVVRKANDVTRRRPLRVSRAETKWTKHVCDYSKKTLWLKIFCHKSLLCGVSFFVRQFEI